MKRKKICTLLRLTAFIPLICWMCLIFGFSNNDGHTSSSQSDRVAHFFVSIYDRLSDSRMSKEQIDNASENIELFVRKAAHFTEYAVFAILLIFALKINNIHGLNLKNKWTYFTVLIITAIYATTDEVHQLFVNGRCASPVDVLIDIGGGAAGTMLVGLVKIFTIKRKKNTKQIAS